VNVLVLLFTFIFCVPHGVFWTKERGVARYGSSWHDRLSQRFYLLSVLNGSDLFHCCLWVLNVYRLDSWVWTSLQPFHFSLRHAFPARIAWVKF
jgi:hypothetical protein